MDNFVCENCFNDQRSYADKIRQVVIDVQKIANEKNKSFAICLNGYEINYIEINGDYPANTVQIIIPM
jgi:hypothetical protein